MSIVAVCIGVGVWLFFNGESSHGKAIAVCPANSFWLSDEQILNLESAALLDGNAFSACRLAMYYSIFCDRPSIGDVWNYRAAQLGDFGCAYDLSMRNLLNDLPLVFSEEILSNSHGIAMSNLAKEYIQINFMNSREMSKDSQMTTRNYITNDWLMEAATVAVGCVEVRNGEWNVRYAAYKTRNRSVNACKNNQIQVLVFPSLPLTDCGVATDIDMSGTLCQRSVSKAESNGWSWIVVAVDLTNDMLEMLGISDEEKDKIVQVVLERVFDEFSLSPITPVMPAGNIHYVNRFKKIFKNDHNVISAPEMLLDYDVKRIDMQEL